MPETLKLPSYGGQALIEGVLMRGANSVALACRTPDGNIVTYTEPLGGIYKSTIKNIPFLRGLIILWDSLGLGTRFLTMSANYQTGEDEKLEGPMLYGTLAVSIALGIGLFFLAPTALGQLFDSLIGWPAVVGYVFEGFLRLIIIITYIWAVGLMKDIQRVFAYHGAEHKTINAFEAGSELTPENVQKFSLEHPRCGTSFLLTVVVLSIILFSPLKTLPLGFRLITQLALLPVLAGIAYEYVRWVSNHLNSRFVRGLIKPNLALQHLTTREPDLAMLEVAIQSFQTMLAEEKKQENQPLSVP